MVAHSCNPSTPEAGTQRLAWVQGCPVLHTVFQAMGDPVFKNFKKNEEEEETSNDPEQTLLKLFHDWKDLMA